MVFLASILTAWREKKSKMSDINSSFSSFRSGVTTSVIDSSLSSSRSVEYLPMNFVFSLRLQLG